jgi:outer membrane protein assembly factor BamB
MIIAPGKSLASRTAVAIARPTASFSATASAWGEAFWARCLVLSLCLGCSMAASAESAASFRADAVHSGLFSATGVPILHGEKWRFKTKGPVASSPVISNGIVYVGSYDRYLYAINESDGKQLWAFKTQGRITSSPAVHAGRVFFASYDGNLYALDARTGEQLWKFAFQGEHRFTAPHLHGSVPAAEFMPDPFDFFLSSPTIVEETLYVGSGDGYVYALNVESGTLRWKFKTGNVVHATPTVDNGTVYIGSWDSYFYALDAKTGEQRWRFKTGEDPDIYNQVGIQSSAVLSAGLVVFGCRDANVYALNAATGEKAWSFANDGSWVISTPVAKDGMLYFATSDSGLLHAVDLRTGVPRYSLSFNRWPMFSSPAIAGHFLYIGSHSGALIAIDLDQHAVAWTFHIPDSQRKAAAISNSKGEVDYRKVFDGVFYDDMVVGVWRMIGVGAVLSSPAIDRDAVYFGSADGNVYALQ